MPTKGRVYLDINGKAGADRLVRSGEEIRLTYYPTSTNDDEPVSVYLRRVSEGPERGRVAVIVTVDTSLTVGGREHTVYNGWLDQPAAAKER